MTFEWTRCNYQLKKILVGLVADGKADTYNVYKKKELEIKPKTHASKLSDFHFLP